MVEPSPSAQKRFDPGPYREEWKRGEVAYRRALRRRVTKARAFLPRMVSAFRELDPGLEKVVLFGSLARGTPRHGEFDIDVAVRSKRYFRLLSWTLDQSWNIDLVDLDEIQNSPLKDVETEGLVLYEKEAR